MLKGNQMANALERVGFKKPKEKRRKEKVFNCKVCGKPMAKNPDENFMVCMNEECEAGTNYFIFNGR